MIEGGGKEVGFIVPRREQDRVKSRFPGSNQGRAKCRSHCFTRGFLHFYRFSNYKGKTWTRVFAVKCSFKAAILYLRCPLSTQCLRLIKKSHSPK